MDLITNKVLSLNDNMNKHIKLILSDIDHVERYQNRRELFLEIVSLDA